MKRYAKASLIVLRFLVEQQSTVGFTVADVRAWAERRWNDPRGMPAKESVRLALYRFGAQPLVRGLWIAPSPERLERRLHGEERLAPR
jgi:hypothetical protein